MKKTLIVLGVIIGLVLLLAVSLYNNLVSKSEHVKSSWAQVENVLQRRADLIPNLVSTVKGYAAHEKSVFEAVTNARSAWTNAQSQEGRIEAANSLDAALARLLMVVENYPQLKADSSFLKLQDELAGAENRISVERMRYNQAVRDYNILLRSFPTNIIARIYGFRQVSEYFKAEEKAALAPEVRF